MRGKSATIAFRGKVTKKSAEEVFFQSPASRVRGREGEEEDGGLEPMELATPDPHPRSPLKKQKGHRESIGELMEFTPNRRR